MFYDGESGLKAFIAIHSTVLGIAGGGCRMYPYASEADALGDVLRLSRAMTLKLALAGFPAGGGKTVVIGDPARDKSEALLRALGRAVNSLNGKYLIAEDVGTTPEDMEIIAEETPFVVGREGASGDTSPATGYGVYIGLRTAVKHSLGKERLDGIKVAVQGVGNVGYHLCRHLAEQGARLFAADVDPLATRRVVDEFGAVAVEPDEIYGLDVDVFAPCALGAVINDGTVGLLNCRIVAGGANNQLAEDRHGEALAARGILYAPDYVINAGGVINAAGEAMRVLGDAQDRQTYDEAAVFRRVETIADTLGEVFALADREGIPPHAAAERLAEQRIRERSR